MAYLDSSPDPFHATQSACELLRAAGFTRLDERDAWAGKLKKGGKYFFTRNKSCVVAFAVGGAYEAGNGFKVIGAHTDSPNLRVKPRSKRSAAGCLQLEVECYGGGLWHTWFDRDLGLSGRVMVRGEGGGVEQRLVRIDRPVLRVPTLCIHLQTADEREAFKEPLLVQMLADELGVAVGDVLDFECSLYDTQRASISGVHSEFLTSSRLDNLASCFVATEAIVQHTGDAAAFGADPDVSLIALFDHEEVGSSSAVGAGSPIMGEAVRRISSALTGTDGGSSTTVGSAYDDMTAAALRKSFVLSADMAHAVHPNYASKHQKSHGPQMNRGVVIKSNQNQRYASNGVTSFLIRELARQAKLPPPQEFVVRNDCPCGSTIGPIISANTGMRAIDLGMPQLSMHSVREMMGVADLTHGLDLFVAFFRDFRRVDESLEG